VIDFSESKKLNLTPNPFPHREGEPEQSAAPVAGSDTNLFSSRTLGLIAAVVTTILLAAPYALAQQATSVTPSHHTMVQKAPPPKPIDWDKVTQEATTLLSKYIQVNTSNPPGNELPAAKMLKDVFLENGIPATTWEPQPGRGVVAARLRGIGAHTKALILLSHMDVVPAIAKEWKVPPFSGLVKDGKIWGRGAIDDKGMGVMELMAMLAIKRAGILLDRDVLFVATSDEEAGGGNGAGWFVDREKNVYSDAGFLLNEGGGIRDLENGKKFYAVSVTEKTPLWLRLTAAGPAGHPSTPPAETAVTRLVRALQKVIDYQTPIRILAPVQDVYRTQAELENGPKEYLNLDASLKDPEFLKKFIEVPIQNAQIRDTITPTVLSGSPKTNMLAATAYAELDCRLLPGSDPQAFVKNIKQVIGDDSIKIDVLLNFPPVSSPSRSELMTAIETLARRTDKCPVVPVMLPGFTDCHFFRQKKIIAYGFMPVELAPAEGESVHGLNESIGVNELSEGIKRMVELLKIFGGRS
jgi:acetylornithine deacetylase/succinyl-diaminopimelate desuccinylase-like protein